MSLRTNLSTRPFYNDRAVRAGLALLALVALGLTVFNAVEIMRLAGDDRMAIEHSRQVLDRQAGQLARIVEDLIDLARIVEKKVEIRKERVAVRSIVETAVETSRPQLEESRLRLTVHLPAEPLFLDADPIRISQVLVNLLNNAAKLLQIFLRPGSAR